MEISEQLMESSEELGGCLVTFRYPLFSSEFMMIGGITGREDHTMALVLTLRGGGV